MVGGLSRQFFQFGEGRYAEMKSLPLLLVLISPIYSAHAGGRTDNPGGIRNCTNATTSTSSGAAQAKVGDLKNLESAEPLLNLKNSSRMIGTDHNIIFPKDDENTPRTVYPRFPEKPTGKTCVHNICEDVDDYPADYILSSLKKSGKYDDYFKVNPLPFEIADRNNFDEEQTLCQTRSHTTYPKTAVSVDKTERIIVNVDGYQQGLVFETCMDTGKCKFSEMFPNDYETSCKQKFAIRRLMALNDDNKPAFDTFEVPSCCVCTFKRKSRR